MMEKTFYYNDFTDDVVESRDQDYALPDDYEWVRKGWWNKVKYALAYALAFILAEVYLRLVLRAHFHSRKLLREYRKEGYFVYGNHTQPVGDPFIPIVGCLGRRVFGLAGTANLGVPVFGKLLPYMGALPVTATRIGQQKLSEAITTRIGEGKVVFMYPEAHVWPYYTQIRPFSNAAFHYQQQLEKKGFTLTTVYRKPKFGKRPRIDIYADGPFVPDKGLKPREQRQQLHDEVMASMQKHASLSDYEYVEYFKIIKLK